MGLLDSVLGAVLGGSQQQATGAGAGGLGSIIGMITNNPQILSTITGMLSNDGGQGGLGGLVGKFQQAGLGDAMGSWIGTGENQAVTGDQSLIGMNVGMNDQGLEITSTGVHAEINIGMETYEQELTFSEFAPILEAWEKAWAAAQAYKAGLAKT